MTLQYELEQAKKEIEWLKMLNQENGVKMEQLKAHIKDQDSRIAVLRGQLRQHLEAPDH